MSEEKKDGRVVKLDRRLRKAKGARDKSGSSGRLLLLPPNKKGQRGAAYKRVVVDDFFIFYLSERLQDSEKIARLLGLPVEKVAEEAYRIDTEVDEDEIEAKRRKYAPLVDAAINNWLSAGSIRTQDIKWDGKSEWEID